MKFYGALLLFLMVVAIEAAIITKRTAVNVENKADANQAGAQESELERKKKGHVEVMVSQQQHQNQYNHAGYHGRYFPGYHQPTGHVASQSQGQSAYHSNSGGRTVVQQHQAQHQATGYHHGAHYPGYGPPHYGYGPPHYGYHSTGQSQGQTSRILVKYHPSKEKQQPKPKPPRRRRKPKPKSPKRRGRKGSSSSSSSS